MFNGQCMDISVLNTGYCASYHLCQMPSLMLLFLVLGRLIKYMPIPEATTKKSSHLDAIQREDFAKRFT